MIARRLKKCVMQLNRVIKLSEKYDNKQSLQRI